MDLPAAFGPYALLERLGRGATGEVFLARTLAPNPSIPSPLVVKRLHPELTASSGFAQRFLHEAKIARALRSPNLVKVYDSGSIAGVLYLAMEHLSGEPLNRIMVRARRARKPLALDWIAGVVVDACSGLTALHEAAAIHRDIAPKNMIVAEDDTARLIDLGLCKSQWQDWKTGTGVVLGTPGYMAPEQCAGEGSDHRADLYALGVILWELLTLEPYVKPGSVVDMLSQTVRSPYRPPSVHRPDLPRGFDELTRRALAVDRAERFTSAKEMARALRSLVPQRSSKSGVVVPADAARIAAVMSLPVPPASSDASDPMIGRTLADRFRVLGPLGQGGSGVVYRALQTSVDREVALKLLRAGSETSPETAERFRQEAKITAGLRSPHTVTVYDFGQLDEGSLFIAMELVSGRSLEAMLGGGSPLPPERVRNLIDQICLSLEEAHARGLVHRDLKPANVMVEERNGADFAKVLDFGIATTIHSAGLTAPGLILGTPAYMSPEQFRPDEKVTKESDFYALGVIAFQLLTGRLPFEGNSLPKLLLQHLRAPPPRLEDSIEMTAEHMRLQTMIDRCLAKRPEERFSSADEIRRLLSRPVRQPPPRPRRRGWLVAAALPLVLVALFLIARRSEPTAAPVEIPEEPIAEVETPPPATVAAPRHEPPPPLRREEPPPAVDEPAPPPPPPEKRAEVQPTRIPCAPSGTCVVEAEVNGTRLKLVVNTTTELTMLEVEAARRAGLALPGSLDPEYARVQSVVPPRALLMSSVALGALSQSDVLIAVPADLAVEEGDGILGRSYLALYSLRLESGQVLMLEVDANGEKHGAHGAGWWRQRFSGTASALSRSQERRAQIERLIREQKQNGIGLAAYADEDLRAASLEIELLEAYLEKLGIDASRFGVPAAWRR